MHAYVYGFSVSGSLKDSQRMYVCMHVHVYGFSFSRSLKILSLWASD